MGKPAHSGQQSRRNRSHIIQQEIMGRAYRLPVITTLEEAIQESGVMELLP